MATFGLICSPVPGHLNPMGAIGSELLRRGHRVILYNIPDTESAARRYGLEFQPVGVDRFPAGSRQREWDPIAKSSGLKAFSKTLSVHREVTRVMCRDIPVRTELDGVDAWIVDQIQFQGAYISAKSKRPFFSVACALHVNRDLDPSYPTPISSARPDQMRRMDRLGSKLLYALGRLFPNPSLAEANLWSRRAGLSVYRELDETFSPHLQIIGSCREFDFPRSRPLANTHFVGNLLSKSELETRLEPGILDGRPLIYVSLGSIHTGVESFYRLLDQALGEFPEYQGVIALGNPSSRFDPSSFRHAKVLKFAPQPDLIRSCALFVTHAGLNGAVTALTFGKPMVAIPIANDQPAVAARIEYHGVGRRIALRELSVGRLVNEMRTVLTDRVMQERAQAFAAITAEAGGAPRAAELIEKALKTLSA